MSLKNIHKQQRCVYTRWPFLLTLPFPFPVYSPCHIFPLKVINTDASLRWVLHCRTFLRCGSRELGYSPWNYVGGSQNVFTHLKMSLIHSKLLLDNSVRFVSSRRKDLCQKWKVKLIFRGSETVWWLDPTDLWAPYFTTHLRHWPSLCKFRRLNPWLPVLSTDQSQTLCTPDFRRRECCEQPDPVVAMTSEYRAQSR